MPLDKREGRFAFVRLLALLLGLVTGVLPLGAQTIASSEVLLIRAQSAWTWSQIDANIVQLQGPVQIQTDNATMTADQAVIRLRPLPGVVLGQQQAQIALIGQAKVEQGQFHRSGEHLVVDLAVRGTIRITAESRLAEDRSHTPLFQQAIRLMEMGRQPPADQPAEPRPAPVVPPSPPPAADMLPPATAPAIAATTQPSESPVFFRARDLQTTQADDGTVAVVLSGGVVLLQSRPNGDFIELQSDSAVLFTPLKSLREIGDEGRFRRIEDAITGAYLEGDVRINVTPARADIGEQRLRASRVFYEFTTDRAILTDAVLHTVEPQRQIPITVRANVLRQLSTGEYTAEGVRLSTSSFATPSYSISADRTYVRRVQTNDPRLGTRTVFNARHTTFDLYGLPVFYLPVVSGSFTDRGSPLRSFSLDNSRAFGTSVRTEWGLFETLGRVRPEELDLSYRVDYHTDRGLATGIDADYRGGFITETTLQPWNFEGNVTSYFLPSEQGTDDLARRRRNVEPQQSTRGRIRWEHQHWLPDDYQIQLRAGYVTDPTFIEQWFRSDFRDGQETELAAYLKRQRQTEAVTLLLAWHPRSFVTTAEYLQELFTVDRLPEVGYHRIGDSLWQDRFTFTSNNLVSGLVGRPSDFTLEDHGFAPGATAGLASRGQTGVEEDYLLRGDFRQQIDHPFSVGQFRFVPYLMARYSGYSDSPLASDKHRLLAGTGLRVSTAMWQVDDTAYSRLLDIHRLRHIIEPELHLFASVATMDSDELFIYDESIDAVHDISALQIALRQRWQTKRGGPGRWRSVDFFTLNIEGNFFANRPDDIFREPRGFRGMFYPSHPEASLARNAINVEALWRLSDSTVILSDLNHNLDQMQTATASIGLAAQRGDRLSYFLGTRYIGEINSTIASFAANYELSLKYSLQFNQSVDLGERENRTTNVAVIRRFDRYFVRVNVYYDSALDESGINLAVFPQDLGFGFGPGDFQAMFQR